MVEERVSEGGAIEDTAEWPAEKYSAYMKKRLGKEYREFINHILNSQVLNPPRNAKCLEIGPGPGWIGIWLAEKRPDLQILGLEPSPDMRRVAKANAESCGVHHRIEFVPGYVENLERFSDDEFDLVFSNESLHHWTDPKQAFLEIQRVLKSNGKLFIRDGKRDLGLTERFVLNVPGRILAGKMWRHWKNSLKASYTAEEIQKILDQIPNHNWRVYPIFLSLTIESA
jgi:ubiquinone/menaquinone biosynthesis C-methylase UbiE